ncbi:unnamed protein product [Adineta steineri]|uniref:TIR domain-containing protein n=1 Tax=Adineta steineri TaxID=433720 RepID=A0A815PNW0_9BILA|nr:unnamed protein product [Adineta steineri]CAF3948810.1 unnamed protein product [Adineta steineri]
MDIHISGPAYTSYLEQHMTSGIPYIKGLYYPINERIKDIKLIRHGGQLIFRRFLLPVQPRENLAADGQLFVEICEKDKEFICLQFWVEDFVHEHNQWKDGGYIDNSQNISCSFNRCIPNKKDYSPVSASNILDAIILNLVKDDFIEICFRRILSNETVTTGAMVSICIDVGYIQKIIQWIRTDKFASHISYIGNPLVCIVYNLSRDNAGLKQLRTEKAFDILMDRKQLINNENNSDLTDSYGRVLIALATSDEQSEDNKKLILDTSQNLYQLCMKTDQRDDLTFEGYHLSELLELLDRAFTNTYVIKHILEDKINEKSTAIQYFTELFLSLYGALLDPEPDELEKRAVKYLLRILLQISSYPEYLKQLIDNHQFCIIIESLANRPKRDDVKRIWCNIQQIMSTNERKKEMSSKIYISYDYTNEEFCKELVKELRKRMTIPIWVDYENVDLSDDMWEYISPNIISATVVIILVSTAYGENTDKFQELSYIISTNKSRDEKKGLLVVATEPNFNFNRSWMKDLLHGKPMVSYENNIGQMAWNVCEQLGVLKKPRIKCLNWLSKNVRRKTAQSDDFSVKTLKLIPENDKVYSQKESSQVNGSTDILLAPKAHSSQSIVTGLITQTGSVSGSTWV